MSGTFRPAPGAATVPGMVLAQAAMEVRLLVRNGEQLLLAVVIPIVVLVGGAEADGVLELGSGRRIDVLTPGVFALAVLSTSFTSLAIATGFERRYGVLKRLGATPLSRSGLLAGKVLAVLCVEVVQLALLSIVASALSWEPAAGFEAVASTVALAVTGTAAFASLALLMAGTLRAEATLALANLCYLVLVLGGAVVVPLHDYPDSVRPLVETLPSGALAEGMRQALLGQGVPLAHLLVLLVWTAAASALCARAFKWE
jgi:ABC-2 type transport system permease protein